MQSSGAHPEAVIPAAELNRHPRGIYTLFFTEMWERMSYYGMRALLILYMVAAVGQGAHGGMGLSEKTAGAIYGLYCCAVYLVALPGGWVADRLFGPRRSILVGGIIIALGHFTLAIPNENSFFAGLLLVILGTALLKPSASTLVGQLYPEGGARRDAGFSLFYMGVNLGSTFGPIICAYLAHTRGWHWGFGAAGVGMVAGIIQFSLMGQRLGDAGLRPANPSKTPARDWAILGAGVLAFVSIVALAMGGVIKINPEVLNRWTGVAIAVVAVAWFTWAMFLGGLDREEKKRLALVGILVVAAAIFWAGFEQAGSSFNLFGERYTERNFFQQEIPAGWFQSVNPILILIFAPIFSWLWIAMARRGCSPAITAKFSGGLLLLGLGFVVMHFASSLALVHGKVLPIWLIGTYLLHTWGELALSPVGLSAVTKLAPARLGAQTMGLWFLAGSLGNLIAGSFADVMSADNVSTMPSVFLGMAAVIGGVALVLALLTPALKHLAHGVE